MTYETALKLKEEGFPQGSGLYINPQGETWGVYSFHKGACYIPTLSELIDACGDGFGNLRRDVGTDTGRIIYGCTTYKGDKGVWGETLEEVVANLWLALNK